MTRSEMPTGRHMKKTTLKIYLQPRSSRDEIIGPYRDGIKVKVTAPAAEGKANQALLQLLAKELNVTPSCIEIIKGHHSREKTLRISNSNPLTLQRKPISVRGGSG
jgi:uncharacterized protein (TIGR00251 family)